MKPALKFWIALSFLFAGVMLLMAASGRLGGRGERSVVFDSAHADELPDSLSGELLKEFELRDQAGSDFDSKSLKGKIWIGSVFFSSCPSTCRVQNMRVAELQQLFGDQGVEFVSVTCDPERDTVAKLGEYSNLFGAKTDRWHFLTGDFELIRRIGGEMFGIVVEKETHSDRLVLFDREGNRVGSYRSTQAEQFDELKTELKELLAADALAPTETPVSESSVELESHSEDDSVAAPAATR